MSIFSSACLLLLLHVHVYFSLTMNPSVVAPFTHCCTDDDDRSNGLCNKVKWTCNPQPGVDPIKIFIRTLSSSLIILYLLALTDSTISLIRSITLIKSVALFGITHNICFVFLTPICRNVLELITAHRSLHLIHFFYPFLAMASFTSTCFQQFLSQGHFSLSFQMLCCSSQSSKHIIY